MGKKDEKTGSPTIRYPTEQLLNSKALSGYQRDFARTLLTGPEYTVQEARDILDKFFKGGAH